MNFDRKLKEIDEKLFLIKTKLDYQKYLTPINFSSENSKFLDCYNFGIIYNPQYKYSKISIDENVYETLDECIKYTQKYNFGIGYLLFRYALNLKQEVEMYKKIGDDVCFSDCCQKVFGTSDVNLKQKALDIMKNSSEVCHDNLYTAECLCERIQQRLRLYGFDWEFILSSNMASRISVEPEQKKIYINKEKMFSEEDIKRLQIHEIDTHVLRVENGMKRGFYILSSGTAGSLSHEEGLAIYNEEKMKVQDESVLKLYAARFLVCCNIDKSFYQNFDMLVNLGCDKEMAMYVVSRIKRGLSDSSTSGGFIKDYVYFQGYNEVKEFIQKKPEMYSCLYYGSISIQDIEFLQPEIELILSKGGIELPSLQI